MSPKVETGLGGGKDPPKLRQPVERGSELLLGSSQKSPEPEDLATCGEERPPHSWKQSRRAGRPTVPQGSLASVPSGSSFMSDSSSCYGNN